MSKTPEVLQGRLGIESGDVTELKPEELQPHPKNQEIYGDTINPDDLDEKFVESVAENGVLEPLVITENKRVISGHRRRLAALEVGVEKVPVLKREFDSDLAEREALIEFNRQREKTPGQLVNEFEEMLAIEEERARERKEANLKEGDEGPEREKFHTREEGRAKDKAAEKVNADVSGRTLEKGHKVKEQAQEGDETAQQEWEKLKEGDTSFHTAYENVTSNESGEEETAERDQDIDPFTSQETDEWSSPQWLVEPLADALNGFDLDPCSGAEISPFAEETYTEDDDGLAQPWHGTVWVNPPYSEMEAWTEKAVNEADRDAVDTIVYLCKGDSSTQWWQEGAANAEIVLAIEGRLSFGDGESAAPFASHILVFGDLPTALDEELIQHGLVLQPRLDIVESQEVAG